MDQIREENHHLRQNEAETIEQYDIIDLARTLRPDAPQLPYKRRADDNKTVNHWGQRKLFMSELEFLTLYGNRSNIVVYAGAAPGTHIPYLSELFPGITFILVDPCDFWIDPTERIQIRKEFFTDEIAKEFSRFRPLFISDIRTADAKVLQPEEVEDAVEEDQRMQMRWHALINPHASMLKFRLPWGAGQTRYLRGDIYIQVWPGATSSETRLVVVPPASGVVELVDYDNTKYEQQMFYHNNVTRVSYYHHDVRGVKGLCHCYDCASEVAIWTLYIMTDNAVLRRKLAIKPKHHSYYLTAQIARYINELTVRLGNGKSRYRTLEVSLQSQSKWFEAKRFDAKKKKVTVVHNAPGDRRKDETPEYRPRGSMNSEAFSGLNVSIASSST